MIFSPANNKLKKLEKIIGGKVYSWDLLSGLTCKFAKECFSRAVLKNNKLKIKDGKHTKFRCYSASQEVLFRLTYEKRKRNTELVKKLSSEELEKLLLKELPSNAKAIRIHVSGDYVSNIYLKTWIKIAKQKPNIIFYGYTKAIPYFLENQKDIPSNYRLTMSRGGTHDHLIDKFKLKEAIVVFSEEEAKDKRLEIDYDDSHAFYNKDSFALLIHGTGPKNSDHAKAIQLLRKNKT